MRRLIVILGDQLDPLAYALEGIDREHDAVWMAESAAEAQHVPSHKVRIAFFLSSMRHFRDELSGRGIRVLYHALSETHGESIAELLSKTLDAERPDEVVMTEAGEWRVQNAIQDLFARVKIPFKIHTDTHFLCDLAAFREHANGRKQLRMEYFYRWMRKRSGYLLDEGAPAGGAWNFDKDNRGAFGKKGPQGLPAAKAFKPDKTTRDVLEEVEQVFAQHAGELQHFDWPVTREAALEALEDFIANRLQDFGRYQDAMWTNEPYLYHSRISAALNVKLLNPREVLDAAEEAYRRGDAPIEAVEGFVRQILGWREYVRGVYWLHMPDYVERNALQAEASLPDFYWTGETDMHCLQQAIGQTLRYGYAHHIQRLMITGLYALLLGVHPKEIHEWYLAVYIDAVEWVELPNTLGMSQYADGGIMASKPYVASGRYIDRMSNYCKDCRFDPGTRIGPDACPFTTLYWDFLERHADTLRENRRMNFQLRNLDRLSQDERADIRRQAREHRDAVGA